MYQYKRLCLLLCLLSFKLNNQLISNKNTFGDRNISYHFESQYELKNNDITASKNEIKVEIDFHYSKKDTTMFSVWPYPATETLYTSLNLEYSNIKTVQVYNVFGNTFELPISKNTLDLSSLEQGLYLLEIIFTTGEKALSKVLKIL